jgi:aspartate/methionine/tyrosine aminotransferase
MNPHIPLHVSKLRALNSLANEATLNFTLGNPIDDFPPELVPYLTQLNQFPLGYSANQGSLTVRSLLASKWNARPEEIVITNGAQGGLSLALMSLIEDRNTHVAISNPGFLAYPTLVAIAGGTPTYYQYDVSKAQRFHLSMNSLIEQIPANCKIVVVNTPGNPVPHQFKQKELKQLAEWAANNKIFLVLDEVYGELNYEESYRPSEYANEFVVSITSFSKSHALAGIRLGSIYSKNETLIKKCVALQQNLNTCASSLAQAIGLTLLQQNLDVPILKRYADAYKERLELFFSNTPWEHLRPQHGFYAFIPVPAGSCEVFSKQLLTSHNMLVTPGSYFGTQGKNFIRIALSTSKDSILDLKKLLISQY